MAGKEFRGAAALVVAGFVACGIAFGLVASSAYADDAPIVNQSFETTQTPPSGGVPGASSSPSSAGLPTGWRFNTFVPGGAVPMIETASSGMLPAFDGAHFLRVSSTEKNHARVLFDVDVSAAKSYRYQAMVRVTGTDATVPGGAVLGLDGQLTVSAPAAPDGQWHRLELYINTGKQAKLTLTMGLGNFGQLDTGTADFDAVSVQAVDAVPVGSANVVNLDQSVATEKIASSVHPNVGPNRFIFVLAGMLALGVVAVGVYLTLASEDEAVEDEAVEDAAFEDAAFEDAAFEDEAVEDSVVSEDSAVSEPAPTVAELSDEHPAHG